MSHKCEVTGKSRLVGFIVSHANNHNKMVQRANVQKKRIFVPELDKWVVARVSASGLRTIAKNGAFKALGLKK
jgi:large subunit ribosomal protein L28